MRLGVLLLFAACDQTLGLHETYRGAVGDRDGDGITDDIDNCSEVPNPSQSDLDGDAVGDACDDCPLVRDATQDRDFDQDGIGDDCDPHPTRAGDCLVLLDGFADPDAFQQNWEVLPSSATDFAPSAGAVALLPSGTFSTIAMLARDSAGALLVGAFAVELSGTATFLGNGASVEAVTDLQDTTSSRIACRLTRLQTTYADLAIWGTRGTGYTLSTDPVGDPLLVRLVPPDPGDQAVRCRVDYGYAVAVGVQSMADVVPDASTGVLASGAPTVVHAIALYDFQPGRPACAPATLR